MNDKESNPWKRKRPRTATTKTSGPSESPGSPARPPRSLKSVAGTRRTGRGSLPFVAKPPEGLRLGSYVRISWVYDRAYGSGHGSFVGSVMELDDWIKVVNRAGVACHSPLSSTKIEMLS